jgi:hypothetical protein
MELFPCSILNSHNYAFSETSNEIYFKEVDFAFSSGLLTHHYSEQLYISDPYLTNGQRFNPEKTELNK